MFCLNSSVSGSPEFGSSGWWTPRCKTRLVCSCYYMMWKSISCMTKWLQRCWHSWRLKVTFWLMPHDRMSCCDVAVEREINENQCELWKTMWHDDEYLSVITLTYKRSDFGWIQISTLWICGLGLFGLQSYVPWCVHCHDIKSAIVWDHEANITRVMSPCQQPCWKTSWTSAKTQHMLVLQNQHKVVLWCWSVLVFPAGSSAQCGCLVNIAGQITCVWVLRVKRFHVMSSYLH